MTKSYPLDQRVSRILGQMRGIQKMVTEQRDHVEILQQISAVKKAIDGVTEGIILDYFEGLVPQEKREEVEKMIKRTVDL